MLICASLLALAACAGEETATTAGSVPSASTAPEPTPSAAVDTTDGLTDQKLCEAAKKAGDGMKAELIASMKAGEPTAADYKKVLTGLNEKVIALASAGGDSKVADALKQIGAEATKAAAAADPATAADNPDFLKAGTDLTAACKAAGVAVIF